VDLIGHWGLGFDLAFGIGHWDFAKKGFKYKLY
jgi:hypothetical protein